jgi:hypothetical protein
MTATDDARRQSLADGVPGIALLHVERARAGLAGWGPVHQLAREMTSAPVQASPAAATLFFGAPAVAYALHAAGRSAYGTALATLDTSIARLIRTRLDDAHRRIDHKVVARASEYDLINGLTGLGAYLLHRHQDDELLRDVLSYLVRLTHPIVVGGEELPGWWAAGSPDRRQSPRWEAGHAGFGMAHGVAGPLALLSIALRRGITADGHMDAIGMICSWFDQWRDGDDLRACWPEVISRDDLDRGGAPCTGLHRPSWCYGTPGIARAQHLAGLALGDRGRTRLAEQALAGCLTDELQLAGAGLCHGWAGLLHTARRAHDDTGTAELGMAIDSATERFWQCRDQLTSAADGLLDGTTGTTLVISDSTRACTSEQARWDACLLVS